jgi:hypothetical protein
MRYIFDTNALIFVAKCDETWDLYQRSAFDGVVAAVRESFLEISRYLGESRLLQWANRYKEHFEYPTEAEQQVVRSIFQNRHFFHMVSMDKLMRGEPVADPFIVAKAKVEGGTVVTLEKRKPNSARIPNVCDYMGVPCISLQQFVTEQQWKLPEQVSDELRRLCNDTSSD